MRTALTVLGVALGTAIVVAIYVMDHNTIQTQVLLQSDRMRGPVDLEVVPGEPAAVEDVVADLRGHAGVAAVAVWREVQAGIEGPDGQAIGVQGYGLRPLPGCPFAHYAVERGRDLAARDAGGAVLLGAEAARRLGVGPGARLQVRERAGDPRYECRDGVLRRLPALEREPFAATVEVAGVLAPHRLGRRNFGEVIVCSHELAQRLQPGGADWFHVQRERGADLDRLRRDLQAAGYMVADRRAARIGEGADERAFRNGLKILGCLALLLGMFVVFQTLSHSLVARVRLLGLLRCLGAGRRAVAYVFLGDALLLGLCGAALGLALGVAFAALLRSWEISSLGGNKPWHTFELPLVPMLWTAALGVLFTLAGAAFPLWRARRLPALWILRQRGLGRRGGEEEDLLRGVNVWLFVLLVGVLPLAYLAMTPLVAEEGRETRIVLLEMGGMVAGIGGLLLLAPAAVALVGRALLWPLRRLLPLAAWLCGKALQRQSGRVSAGVVGLAAVLLAFLGLQSITASLRGDVRAFAAVALGGRAFAEVPARTAASCAEWGELPGVAGVEPIEGEVAGPYAPFLLRGVGVAHMAAPGGALEGRQDLVRRFVDPRVRTLVASRRLALKMGWQPGTLVPLRDRNLVPVSYEVLAVSDASGYVPSEQAWAVCSPHWLVHDFCVPAESVRHVTLRLEPGTDWNFVADRLRAREPQLAKFRSGELIRDYHLRDVNRDFYLFDLLLVLILLLAGTGLLNGMTIAALGRGRELGVLRALGIGRRSLGASLVLEGLVVGALAALLALLLAVPMAHVLIAGLNRVAALQAPTVLPGRWLWVVPPVALLVGAAAACLPAWRAMRQDPAEAVRYE